MTDHIIDCTQELRYEINENVALVLWCFLLEQAMLIAASRRDEEWRYVFSYLMRMLEKGPKAAGLLEFADSAPKLAASISAGEIDQETLLRNVRDHFFDERRSS
jgi:hypothetical protein